jgi:hypothetical protein
MTLRERVGGEALETGEINATAAAAAAAAAGSADH